MAVCFAPLAQGNLRRTWPSAVTCSLLYIIYQSIRIPVARFAPRRLFVSSSPIASHKVSRPRDTVCLLHGPLFRVLGGAMALWCCVNIRHLIPTPSTCNPTSAYFLLIYTFISLHVFTNYLSYFWPASSRG
ncbi:hypothetical protein F5Y19DRAFT_448640 [Xylariaceae sp. FL1651]|nr:hypothetical protein F5Y19DRAFT_448640 [Xylariaceae sp. FL1651]